jgi:hypothetical protein
METDVYDLSEAGAVRRDLRKSDKSAFYVKFQIKISF